jgi:hypothetical protein
MGEKISNSEKPGNLTQQNLASILGVSQVHRVQMGKKALLPPIANFCLHLARFLKYESMIYTKIDEKKIN